MAKVTFTNLTLTIQPTTAGRAYWGWVQIDGVLMPEEWKAEDWKRVGIGSKFEFLSNKFHVVGQVESVSWGGSEIQEIQLTGARLEGEEESLERGSLGDWGNFHTDSTKAVFAEPHWLLPEGVALPLSVYHEIKERLRGWRPVRPLTWSEVYLCVSYASESRASSSPDALVAALAEAKFGVHPVVKEAHNAQRLAENVWAAGWPAPSQTILDLLFDIDDCRWAWVLPGSLVDDYIGLAVLTISKEEFWKDRIAMKALSPNYLRTLPELDSEPED